MKMFFAFAGFALIASTSVAQPVVPSSLDNIAQSLTSTASSSVPLPEAKGRKGSKRVGGYTSKGKGSRYVGGRR
ncbi:TPA: hypothetical protein JD357_005702 [Citrobacter freundii]|uniref:Uncharacterized protein n=1 Tax=Citrobacter freundii TaxID=546 RepID=A0A7R7I935_CITFR|nr:hypothetical protein [uncultured bacterium]BCM23515.1 hypothetical protein [Citrobacter freundii]HAZ3446969.1 hypothetical protein [Citrobacter freundii]